MGQVGHKRWLESLRGWRVKCLGISVGLWVCTWLSCMLLVLMLLVLVGCC